MLATCSVTADGTTIAHPEAKYNGEKLSSYLPQVSLTSGAQHIEMNGDKAGQPYAHR